MNCVCARDTHIYARPHRHTYTRARATQADLARPHQPSHIGTGRVGLAVRSALRVYLSAPKTNAKVDTYKKEVPNLLLKQIGVCTVKQQVGTEN